MMNQTKMEDVLPLKKKQPLSNCYQWLKEENDMPATLMKYPPLENHIVMRPALGWNTYSVKKPLHRTEHSVAVYKSCKLSYMTILTNFTLCSVGSFLTVISDGNMLRLFFP